MHILPALAFAVATLADTATRDTLTAVPADSIPALTIGGFIDTYYAWDSGRPRSLDRAFTTQPARHNEFNINLAYVELVLAQPRLRGRLALQAGTSVQANYAAEPRVGAVSGGDLSRLLQEATVGVQLHPRAWLDVGTYFSHIGLEGWISRDNPTYTRSLIADYTPYYLSGARLTWQVTPRITAQVHLVNGWQNVSETNADKALGTRLDWQVTPALLVSWRSFVGNEQPESAATQTRVLQQVLARWAPPGWEWSLVLDAGRQGRGGGGRDTWQGGAFIGRRALTSTTWVSGRVEALLDPDHILLATPGNQPFRTRSASVGLDVQLERRALWRTELRGFRSSARIWPSGASPDGARGPSLLVTSLAITL